MEKIRSFIAIQLSADILSAIADLQRRLKSQVPEGTVRWVQPKGIHLTLQFLGDVPSAKINSIAQAMTVACAPFHPFPITVGGLGCFPNAKRPRVTWVGVDEPTGTLAALQKAVERAMVPLGFEPEKRAFHPHLTLGRTQRRATRDQAQALGALVTATQVTVLGQMDVDRVNLIRSDLRPTGAVYTPLTAAPLTGK
jgi:2'-5' RNA ligase